MFGGYLTFTDLINKEHHLHLTSSCFALHLFDNLYNKKRDFSGAAPFVAWQQNITLLFENFKRIFWLMRSGSYD